MIYQVRKRIEKKIDAIYFWNIKSILIFLWKSLLIKIKTLRELKCRSLNGKLIVRIRLYIKFEKMEFKIKIKSRTAIQHY